MGVSNSRQPSGRSREKNMLRPAIIACFLFLFGFSLFASINAVAAESRVAKRGVDELPPSVINLNIQDAMRELRRMKRTATKHPRRRNDGGGAHNDTGKCVISADQAVHYCGFTEEVTAPIIPPPQQGQCYSSPKSGREICYPTYEELDTTCTDSSTNDQDAPGPVPPPAVPHATVRAMAFVAPDDLQRLIKQYYRQNQQPIPKDINYKINAYLFARYRCDFGYELIDEVDTVFCSNRKWVSALPECRGKGPCKDDNGGCSHSCISPDNSTVECRCPKGMVLDVDERTCIKPAPKNMCKNLAGCTCESINENQLSCTCRPSGEKCLLVKGPPKIFMHPPPPYQVEPGGSLNITCSGVGYPFPQTNWESNGEVPFEQKEDPTARYNQVLSVSELAKNGQFTCHSVNKHGPSEKTVDIVVAGPGAASLDRVDPGRTTMDVHWHPPEELNRPITHYTVYYTNNGNQPVKNWKHIDVNEPNRHVLIEALQPDTQYTIRVRANDNLGPGKLSNAISVKTKEAAKRPLVEIAEGEELRVPPGEAFTLNCNVTRGDPTPHVVWESKGRKISNPQEGRSIALQHKGLFEETSFLCVAENEAGKTSKRVHVIVTGPIAPEKIRSDVDGDDVVLQWEPPRITNGPMEDYEVLYTTDPSKPEDEWQRVNTGGKTDITLPDLQEQTEYTFRVRGKNVNGDGLPSRDHTVTTWLKPRPPVVTLSPDDPIVAAPSTQELSVLCEASGVPKPKILWFWNNEAVEDGKDGFRVYDVSEIDVQNLTSSKLIAQSTTRTGSIRCEAVNREGDDQKSVDVKIKGPGSPPLNIQPSPDQNGFKVDWAEPEIPNGQITNYVIYYTKDPDKALNEWQTETVPGDKLNELISNKEEDTPYVVRVQAVTDDGPGIISEPYEVTTGKKHIPLTVRLELIEPELPDGEEEVTVEPAQPIRFRCVAEGRPAPAISYTWLPINSSESGQEPVHIRSSPHESAEHTYMSDESQTSTHTRRYLLCQARNPDGSVDDRVTFAVKKPGSPPLSIDPTIDVDNKVTIQWNPPTYPNGELDHYKVYLSADPSKPLDQWQTFDVHDLDNPKIEFNRGELEPETPYFVQVSAVNKDGEGVKSPEIKFETVSGAPIDTPSDVLAVVEPDNSVNLSWAGPSQPNGPIKSYTVYFTPADSDLSDDNYKQWQKINIPSTEDLGNITLDKDDYKIQPNTPYKVRVTATNDLSEGPASEPITFTTGTGEIPPTIQLEPPANPASINPKEDYTVTCAAIGIPTPSIYWTVGDRRVEGSVLQLSALTTDTVATCHAENNAGQAQEALRIEVKGPGAPPTTVAAEPLPDQEVTVEWTPPDITNGQITGYVVQYGEIPEGDTTPTSWDTVTVPGAELQTTLKDLKPKTNYAVKVQAVSDRGPGVISDPFRTRTLPLAPPPPQEAKVDVADNNTVLLEFDAVPDPEDPSKKIKDYKISYTHVDPDTDETVWNEMSWTHPDDSPTIKIPIDGENFKPNTKYNVKIIPKGEIEGTASDPVLFETGDGVIAPDQPTFNVDAADNTIRVPAGTDYSVTCSSEGHPAPKIRWVNETGETVSEGAVLRMDDVRTTQKLKCIAENVGGTAEEDFTIYVAGPGNAPEITQLHAHKPRTIEAKWEPPTIPNGEITRYIIYYTPLDDQTPSNQVGQVPSKPVVEWLTYHQTGENLNEGQKSAVIKDFLEPDTAYAVVIQAVNDDGPGPYSHQHTIRTMSKAQEGPPTDLRVEPIDQRSVEVDWKPPENTEEQPIGYELYYVPANIEIEVDEFDSLPKWTKIAIDSGDATSHVINNQLEANTEYVFKIRALYPNGPGVFSEPCITKTLPEGDAPIIMVSSGGQGKEGSTSIDLLPGSSLLVFCNATGSPQPSVNWIRQGSIAIDPSTVKAEETATRWSLNVANITEDTTFICVAQNPLGIANWSISLNVVDDMPVDWRRDSVKAKIENDDVLLTFEDKIPAHLKEDNNWVLRYTDDPNKPRNEWTVVNSDGRPLNNLKLDDPKLGKAHYLTITDPSTGIVTPVFTVVTPNPARITNLGANINDEVVVDFKPAIGSSDIKDYEIRFWPANDPSNVRSQTVGPDSLNGNVIDDLTANTDYDVQVITSFDNGDVLPGTVVQVKTPPADIHCDCSHACRVDKDGDGQARVVCYCPSGYELDNDGKTCTRTSGAEHEQIVVEVTPASDLADHTEVTSQTEVDGSVLPTDEDGQTISVEEDDTATPYPTDSLGREIKPIVRIDGSHLKVDNDGNTLNQLGNPVERDESDRPLDPNGQVLSKNDNDEWLYPELDQAGRPLPFDREGRPVYPILDSDGNLLPTNNDGQRTDKSGTPIPTNAYGRPVGPDSSPLPLDDKQNYRFYDDIEDITDEPVPTDITGRLVYPIVDADNELLPTSETGRHTDRNGIEIPLDERGVPLNQESGKPLAKNDRDQYIFGQRAPVATDDRTLSTGPDAEVQTNERTVPIIGSDGQPFPTNNDGLYLAPDGQAIERDGEGRPLDADGQLLPKNDDARYVYPVRPPSTTEAPPQTVTADQSLHPTDSSGRRVTPVFPDGRPLPTDASGAYVKEDGSLMPTNPSHQFIGPDSSPLPLDDGRVVVYSDADQEVTSNLPTDDYGKRIHDVVGEDGQLLLTDTSGRYLNNRGEPIPIDDFGRPIGPDGQVLEKNDEDQYVHKEQPIPPTDSSGRPVVVVGPDGVPLEKNNEGYYLNKDNTPVPTNAANEYVGSDSSPLPIDSSGRVVLYPDDALEEKAAHPTDQSGRVIYPIVDSSGDLLGVDHTGRYVNPRGELIPLDEFGRPLGPDNKPLPQNAQKQYVFVPVERPEDRTERPIDVIKADSQLPTDRPAPRIVNPAGELLPTDPSSGRHVDQTGALIPVNKQGEPMGPDDQPLQRDDFGNYVHPSDKVVHPTDISGVQIVPVRPDGTPLRKHQDGYYINEDNQPLPTNAAHQFVGADGSPLPVINGQVVVHPDGDQELTSVLPTDSYGKPVYRVVGSDGSLLPTDPTTGRYVDQNQELISVDDNGRPLGADGQVLPKNEQDEYVLTSPKKVEDATERPIDETKADSQLPTDGYGRPIHRVIGPDGGLLPTSETGHYLKPSGAEIEVDSQGRPIGPDGELLATNEDGEYIFVPEDTKPTDSSGRPVVVIGEDGSPLPTDSSGLYRHPDGGLVPTNSYHQYIGPDGSPLPVDDQGRVLIADDAPEEAKTLPTDEYGVQLHPIVDKDGELLSTDSTGRYVNSRNEPIPLNNFGKPLDSNGEVLPTDESNRFIYTAAPDVQPTADGGRTLPTDSNGQVVYPIVGSDGELLPTDFTGHHTDDRGDLVPVDQSGVPLDARGNPLKQNERGEYVHGEDRQVVKPTDTDGGHVTVIGPDGLPLPTDSSGIYLQPDGGPVPTNIDHQYTGSDGSPLPVDENNRVIFDHGTDEDLQTLPTDSTGKKIQQVVGPDGKLLPTDTTGRHQKDNGEPIEVDDFGRPLSDEGHVLPTNAQQQFVYSGTQQPLIIGPDGQALARDDEGRFLSPDGSLIQKDGEDRFLGPDGAPLEKNEDGQLVYKTDVAQPLSTDATTGRFVYPVYRPDGTLLRTDSNGRYIGDDSQLIPIDDYGRPIDSQGAPLSKDQQNRYIYSPDAPLRPTDVHGRPIQAIGPDGSPLPTDASSGSFLNPQGSPIPTNENGELIGPDGAPYPTNDRGIVIVSPDAGLTAQTLPTDGSRRVIMPVVDVNGAPRPTEAETGLFLDVNGFPLPVDEYGRPSYPNGELLQQDGEGNYVYEDRRKKISKHCFIDGYIELLIVLDTSANVKILDHRLMKETIKSFLKENFDLRENRVRVGVVKFGSEVEVPIALGDYNNAAELLNRLGDARRLKGAPRLGEALRDTVSEFTLSGSPNAPKVVLVIKNGKADDEFALPAEMLRDQVKAEVFVVTVGEDDDDNTHIVGSGNSDRVFHFKNWRDTEPGDFGVLADGICRAVPEDRRQPTDAIWPVRPTRPQPTQHRECSTIEYEVDLVVVLDSSKFTDEEFTKTIEGVGTLIDESFDLAPDVVRVGFVVFSDKVSVPVALGHYEDKIELLQKIEDSERMEGTAIAVKGLDAAREQFQLHGRAGVSKVVLLITNGNYRGNAAAFANDLREKNDIQLFVLAINAASTRHSSLARLVGVQYADERLLKIETIDDIASKLNFIRTSLCGRITHSPVKDGDYETTDAHRTSKREVTLVPISVTKGLSPPPSLCDPNRNRMSVNIVIDAAGGEDVDPNLNEVRQTVESFLDEYYAKNPAEPRPVVNLLNINSQDRSIARSRTNVSLKDLNSEMTSALEEAKKQNDVQRQATAIMCGGH